MDEEDKIINYKPLLSESHTKDEFRVESRILHHCGIEVRNGSKKADGEAEVCVAGRWVNRGRWSRSSWSVWLVVAGGINSENRNVVEGNWVQVRVGVSTAQARTKSARKPGSVAGWKIRSCCGLESSSATTGTSSEIRIGCNSERSLCRTGSAASLSCIHFRQDQNRLLTGSAPDWELVFGCLTGRITTKGSLQANTSELWHWTLNVFGYLKFSREGRRGSCQSR